MTSNAIVDMAAFDKRWFVKTMAGWWFGTCFIFPYHIGDVIIPIDELIFFRGVGFNHQPVMASQCPQAWWDDYVVPELERERHRALLPP